MASSTDSQQSKELGQQSPAGKSEGWSNWFAELKRRRVFRALVGYGIAAFAVLQIIEPILHGLHWPETVLSYVVAALAAGFPVVITLASWQSSTASDLSSRAVALQHHWRDAHRRVIQVLNCTMVDSSKLFQSTAAYYARFRPSYPAALFDHLVSAYQLTVGSWVADVGCGTGQIAIPLAARGINVIGIDVSAEMLAEAAKQAMQSPAADRIRWVQGVAEELPRWVERPVRLVTFGASFHWMKQELVLRHCDQLVESDGGVAVIAGGVSPWTDGKPAWSRAVLDTVKEFLGARRRAGDSIFTPPSERHEEVLARSAFNRVDVWTQAVEIERTLEQMIGLQYSTSYSSPALLGERREAFEAALRARLQEACPEGRFVESYQLQALCARRPKPSL